ncbi:hypothetical protein [Flavobacterium sp. UBA4197]|uniref:hypothetical protein n=1 Tax=Flavobacterium sp. UBA4197 TaxID=1946546 RepID=UPI002580450D|nr:hypothetical protein [Flavobacterium sp. UBA4197]
MKIVKAFFTACSLLLLLSCAKDKKGGSDDSEIRERYYNLEKIGWKSKVYSQKVDQFDFTATEVPIQYYLLKDKGNANLFLVDSLYNDNKRERVIEFTFEQENEKDILDPETTGIPYEDGVKYMSFSIENDFSVVINQKDTIPCSGALFERSYKITPYQKVMLFFSNIDPNAKIQLLYKDNLFKKGTLKFQFKDPFTEIAL